MVILCNITFFKSFIISALLKKTCPFIVESLLYWIDLYDVANFIFVIPKKCSMYCLHYVCAVLSPNQRIMLSKHDTKRVYFYETIRTLCTPPPPGHPRGSRSRPAGPPHQCQGSLKHGVVYSLIYSQ